MIIIASDLASTLQDILPQLWSSAFRLSGCENDAEKLVLQVSVYALDNAHRCPPDLSVTKWMLSILYACWRDGEQYLNKPVLQAASEISSTGCQQKDLLYQSTIEAAYRLPKELRSILLMVNDNRMTPAEVAQLVDLPMSDVLRKISHARILISSGVSRV